METFNDITGSGKLVLVDFFATWCGPCKMMHPVLEAIKQEMGDKLRIVKVDVDENELVSQQYRIQSVPTLMIFKDGEVVWRHSGAMPQSALTATIEQYL